MPKLFYNFQSVDVAGRHEVVDFFNCNKGAHIQRTYTYIVRAFWIEVDNKGIQVFVLLVTSEFLSYRLQDGESFHDGCKKKFSGNHGEVGYPHLD